VTAAWFAAGFILGAGLMYLAIAWLGSDGGRL
jgi:hypothetical protein